VFATMGDGIAAAFTSADGAVRAALAAQRAMPPTGLGVRMGIHTGEVERVGDDLRGRALNRAARIMAAGHGGQILLSDLTATLVRNGPNPVPLVALGVHRLRDLTEPERMWQIEHPELPSRFPPVRGVDSYATNLPAQRSSLVGRELDVQRLVQTIAHHRVITLTGVGGVGKTRLAVHAAADLLPDVTDVWFVELASISNPDDVADAVAVALGAATVADPIVAVTSLLGGNRTLLVIDNCEHVLDGAADVVDKLTAACPNLSVIATSREPLGIYGEQVIAVRPLDTPTAVELFCQRAGAAGADLAPVATSDIEDLCRRLEGLPLALELAAARTASLGVPALVAALERSFAVLDAARRRGDDRHCTMRATIEWSYRLLEPAEQRMFQRLAVFSSGMELDAVLHVAATMGVDAQTATDQLDSLVTRSLLVADTVSLGVRYRMLETMRAFALEVLDAAGERDAAARAHAEWVATITDLPYSDCCNAAVERNSIRLEREADNWRDAILLATRHGDGELAARLCGPPVAYFLLGRHDLADVVRPLVDLCDGVPERRRAIRCALIVSAAGATDPADVQAWVDEIVAIDQEEPTGLGGLMQWMALAWRGDFVTSTRICVTASLDERLAVATRDLFVGIAVLDHFSLTDATDDRYGLIPRALEVADRSTVGISRVSSLLGAAWGLAATEPRRALGLVRRALDDIPCVPALTRLTLPGSASRLLTRLDPAIAARGLLDQLDATRGRRTFVDLIPLFYGAELLHGLGHPSFATKVAPLTVSPAAPYLSMMDFVDVARRAFSAADPMSLDELESAVRSALEELSVGVDELQLVDG
jgi:predicted ATPase